MTFKEKVELAMYMALWTRTAIKSLMADGPWWHDFCRKVITRPNLFTEETAERVYFTFILFTRHTEWQLQDLDMLMVRHRPELALKLGIVGSPYDLLAEMIRDPGFSNHAVGRAFHEFMDQDKTRTESVDLLRVIRVHRPALVAEFDYTPTVH